MGVNTLTFKEWSGSGSPDVKVEWHASQLGTRSVPGGNVIELKITRKSDVRSGRLKMMAELNRRDRSLAWGFTQVTQISEHPSMDNPRLMIRSIVVLTSVGVADFKYIGGNEETITFIANKKSEVEIPIGIVGP